MCKHVSFPSQELLQLLARFDVNLDLKEGYIYLPFVLVIFMLFIIFMCLWHVYFYFIAKLGIWVKLGTNIQNIVVHYINIYPCNVFLYKFQINQYGIQTFTPFVLWFHPFLSHCNTNISGRKKTVCLRIYFIRPSAISYFVI